MSSTTQELTIRHEQTVMVETVRCDGPGCTVLAHTQPPWQAFSRHPEFQADTAADWYYLGTIETRYEFCSWQCVREFMLGKAAP